MPAKVGTQTRVDPRATGRRVVVVPRAENRSPAARAHALQRTIGNQAVLRLMAANATPATAPRPVVQRMQVMAADFDSVGKKAGLGQRVKGFLGVGISPDAVLKKVLAEYEQEKGKPGPVGANHWRLLMKLEELCDKYLATKRGGTTAVTAIVRRLKADLPNEQVALAKQHAQEIYLSNLVGGTADPHNLTFATNAARAAGRGAKDEYASELAKPKPLRKRDAERHEQLLERMKLVKEKGLTPAESAAITAYTAEDYQYINPATANDPAWMGGFLKSRDEDATLAPTAREEGSLHAAVAMDGLRKLDPFQGVSYRGDALSEADLRSRIVVGQSPTRMNLLSTSKRWDIPIEFASRVSGSKDIAVFWVFDHVSGDCGGRDVTALSAMAREGEILIMIGAPFTIRSVAQVGTPEAKAMAGKHSGFYNAIAADQIMKLAERVYFVHVVGKPKPKAQ